MTLPAQNFVLDCTFTHMEDSEMLPTIKAEERTLEKIFSDDYLFEIPYYQRPYSWTKEETNELLDDVIQAMTGEQSVDEIPMYFLGSIVLDKDPSEASARVVDGQQRLITLTILFCVLRELSGDESSRRAIGKRVLQEGDKFAGKEDRFRLTLRERDGNFFKDRVQTAGKLRDLVEQDVAGHTETRQRFQENAKSLWEALSNETEDKRMRLTEFLVRRCCLVSVSVPDRSTAFRIFSVLNTRGLDLLPVDILKANILGGVPNEHQRGCTDKWEGIEEDLGRENFNELFSHIRMIYLKSKARETLDREFEEGVLTAINGRDFIDSVLEPYGDAYQIISMAAYQSTSGEEKVNAYLRHLGRIDNDDWKPPAIEFFRRNRDNQEGLIRFTRDLERLAYALFICRQDVNKRISRYAKVLRELEAGDDLFAESSALQLAGEDKDMVIQQLDGLIYQQTKVRRPLLLRLDSLLADEGVTYDHKTITIEHVLPQTPPSGSEWCNLFNEDERAAWTDRLANLVLLSRRKNSTAYNHEFNDKKDKYFKVGGVALFALTSQVLNEPTWTPEVLGRRQKDLIGRLKKEWRLD